MQRLLLLVGLSATQDPAGDRVQQREQRRQRQRGHAQQRGDPAAAAPAGQARPDAGEERRDTGQRAAEHGDLAHLALRVQADAVRARHGASLHAALPEEGMGVAALELVHDPQLLERLEDAAVGVGDNLAALEGRVR